MSCETWYWKSDDGCWEPFSTSDCVALENEHAKGSDTAILTRGSTMYDIDLSSYRQTNINTGFVRKISRGMPTDPTMTFPSVEEEEEEEEHFFHDDDEEEEERESHEAEEDDDDDEEEDDDEDDDRSVHQPAKKSDDKTSDSDIEMDEMAPASYLCSLTHTIMDDPVITESGSTFERSAIERWLQSSTKDPLTNETIGSCPSTTGGRGRGRGRGRGKKALLIPNRTLKDAIDQWKDDYRAGKLKKKNEEKKKESSKDKKRSRDEATTEDQDPKKVPRISMDTNSAQTSATQTSGTSMVSSSPTSSPSPVTTSTSSGASTSSATSSKPSSSSATSSETSAAASSATSSSISPATTSSTTSPTTSSTTTATTSSSTTPSSTISSTTSSTTSTTIPSPSTPATSPQATTITPPITSTTNSSSSTSLTTTASPPTAANSSSGDNNTSGKDLEEGESVQIESQTSSSVHTIKLIGGVYSCSCPSWRFAGGPIDMRSCKHLRSYRGDEAEDERLGTSNFGNRWLQTTSSSSSSRPVVCPLLVGKVICFTGSLSIVRRVAERHSISAGASVSKSVTRNTDIVVAGPGAGVKLSDAEVDGKEIWDEQQFLQAISGAMSASSTSSATSSGRSHTSTVRATPAGGRTLGSSNSLIPTKIMLAEKWKEGTDPTNMLLSEKLDGMRAWWDGQQLYSRLGNVIHAPVWFTQSLPSGFALDGELFCGRGKFQECMSICRRMNGGEEWKKVTYLVFDAPEMGDKGYEERYKKASEEIEKSLAGTTASSSSSSDPCVKMHPYKVCLSASHLKEELEAVEELSGEGLMLRQPNSKYKNGRSKDLLKVKSSSDDEGVVLSYENGRGRHVGRVGALCLQNRAGKKFKVGTGLTDDDRENPPPIGSVITYRYTELTTHGVPRFPVFLRVRTDVEAGDIVPGYGS